MIVVVTGPTAVGKTKMSVALAKKYNAVVVNADSMQVYKRLDIGTAKVTEEEKEGVKHLLFDIVNPEDMYTVYDYQKDLRKVLDEYSNQNIVIVGGTGLYIKAGLYNYEFSDETDYNTYDDKSNLELYNLVKEKYPNLDVHVNNRKRLIRALNKGEEYSNKGDELLYKDVKFIGLTTDRDVLYDRINKRVDIMIENGLVDEVNSLKESFTTSKALKTAIGYKEFIPYFNSEITLDEVISKIKQNSRHYAKRQYTFFNNQLNVTWYQTDFNNFDNTVKLVIEDLDKE